MDPICILHLSDFHVGKDGYGQQHLFEQILAHLESRQQPDLLLITGDIANHGLKAQYRTFITQFLKPLRQRLPDLPIFMVPGNHDVDRAQARSSHRYDMLDPCPDFFLPNKKGRQQREALHPRFKAYVTALKAFTPTQWLTSAQGSYSQSLTLKGHDLGILLLNTAWLAGDDGEKEKLRLGQEMVREGLKQHKATGTLLVLGHHPLTWLHEKDQEKLKALFGQRQLIYLCGHVHQGKGQCEEGAFLHISAGACFQARENPIWVNGFQWYHLDPAMGQLLVEPLAWDAGHQEWKTNPTAFPNKRRVTGQDRWLFEIPKTPGKLVVEPQRRFCVRLLSTDEDLGDVRAQAAQHLRDTYHMDVQAAGAALVQSSEEPWDLVCLIQAWQWQDGQAAKAWQQLPSPNKCLVQIDEAADWPPNRLMEHGARAAILEFRNAHPKAVPFNHPNQLPGLIGELAAAVRQQQGGTVSSGIDEQERAYLRLNLPNWSVGRSRSGGGFQGVDEIYSERIYVPLDGSSSRYSWDEKSNILKLRASECQTVAIERAEQAQTQLRKPLGFWASRPEIPWLVLSGSPGSGKTVFLTRLAATLAQQLLGQPGALEPNLQPSQLGKAGQQIPLPIHLEANALARARHQDFGDLVTAVRAELGCTANAPSHSSVSDGLRAGRYLILIDALDEVPELETRHQLLRWLKGLRGSLQQTRVLLTTRSARYTGDMAFGPEFEPVELLDLNPQQMEQICRHFCVLKQQGDAFLNKLIQALAQVADKSGSEETHLVGNPLLLNTACAVFYKLGHLPNDRASLCDQVVEHLCQAKVSRLEGEVPKGREDWKLEPGEKRDLLERIAHGMQVEAEAQQWPLAQVYEVVAESLPAAQRAQRPRLEQYVQWLVVHTGLLYFQGSAQGEAVRFHHRLFREYLAACRLKNQDKTMAQLIDEMYAAGWLTNPVWLDVIRLLPGAMNDPDKAKVMGEHMLALAAQDPARRGRLLATLAAAVVENRKLFRLFDTQQLVLQAVKAYEAEAQDWDTETNRLLLEQLGWLGDPRTDFWHPSYWQAYAPARFIMGEGKTQRHETIEQPYWLGRYAVTNSQYAAFMADGGYSNKAWWSADGWKRLIKEKWVQPEYWEDSAFHNPSQPVIGISWHEAQAFCRWLTDQLSQRPMGETAYVVDLPISVEWEFAARGEHGRPYPWAAEVKPRHDLANYGRKHNRTTPVGSYPLGRTPEGLCDMAGNLWEWSSDPYGDDGDERVLRGGAWYSGADFLRAAYRRRGHVWFRVDYIGFRCVLRRLSPEHG